MIASFEKIFFRNHLYVCSEASWGKETFNMLNIPVTGLWLLFLFMFNILLLHVVLLKAHGPSPRIATE